MNRCPVQGKRQFTSSKTAWEFVWHFELDKRPTEPTRNWHVYKCKNCKTWHLTNQERWRLHPNTVKIQAVKDLKNNAPIKLRPIHSLIENAYNRMYIHLGIKKPKTTLVGVLPLKAQRRILQELTKEQSTGAI